MSTINQVPLETHLQSAINAVTTTTSFEDLLLLSSLIGQGDYTSTVNYLTELPDLIMGATPPGTYVFVTSIDQMAVAGVDKWYSLDGKILRYDSSGQVWTWGSNSYGMLGNNTPTTASVSSPGTTAGGGTDWSQVSFGNYHTASIKTDGTLWTWGRNGSGQLGNNTAGAGTSRSSPGTTAGGGTNWSIVSCGNDYISAIKTDGSLWAWGWNLYGQIGNNSNSDQSSPVTAVGGGTNWSMIGGGGAHNTAIKTDGTLWTWGYNGIGQLGTGNTTNRSSPGTTAGGGTNWSTVHGGGDCTAAIKTDGTLWIWGKNNFGQLGDNSVVDKSSPVTTAGGGTNWIQCDPGGYNHSSGIKTDGTLWTWGYNNYGQLGTNDTASRSSPGTTSGGGTNWSQVSCGWFHTGATKTDGTLWTWGNGIRGQLGNNFATTRLSPITTAGGGTNWSQISCNYYQTSAISQV